MNGLSISRKTGWIVSISMIVTGLVLGLTLTAMLGSTFLFGSGLALAEEPIAAVPDPIPVGEPPRVQLALLLDTSGSMSGLIGQAKAQLWRIVNQFAEAEQNGVAPRVEVALFEYGNDGLPAGEGHIRMIVPFTTDLDRLSEELFSLTTNGGQEYCGHVIRDALQRLDWSRRENDLKAVFIAGNEPFTQGTVEYRAVCPEALERRIKVNTIFCGDRRTGSGSGWEDGARLGGGKYLSIDHNHTTAYIAAPQDDEIRRLNNELNWTYLYYGREGKAKKRRQVEQDENAAKMGEGSFVQRAESKASRNYRNNDWDIVDALKSGKDVANMPEEELPEEMRRMKPAAREKYVEAQAKRRDEIQERIQKLSEEREEYVAKQRAAQPAAPATLDEAVVETVTEQAAEVGLKLK